MNKTDPPAVGFAVEDPLRSSLSVALVTWLSLVVVSVLGWLLAGEGSFAPWRSALVIAIALLKIAIVLTVFMGLGKAPRLWQWCWAVGLVLFGAVMWLLTADAL